MLGRGYWMCGPGRNRSLITDCWIVDLVSAPCPYLASYRRSVDPNFAAVRPKPVGYSHFHNAPYQFALLVVVFPGPNHRGARYHCQDNTCLFFSLRVSITSRTENLLPVDEFKVLPAIRPLWVHHLHYKLYGSVIPLYLRWVMGHSRIIARPLTSIICMFITLSDQRLPKKVTSSLRDVGSRPRMSAASQSSSVVMAI